MGSVVFQFHLIVNLESKTYETSLILEQNREISLHKLQCKKVLDSAEPQGGIRFGMVFWDYEELEDDRPHKMKLWIPSWQ